MMLNEGAPGAAGLRARSGFVGFGCSTSSTIAQATNIVKPKHPGRDVVRVLASNGGEYER